MNARSSNPFVSDGEEVEQPQAVAPKKKATSITKKKATAVRAKKAVPSTSSAPVFEGPLLGAADSESDEELPCAQSNRKRRRILQLLDSEDEQEPVRASSLKFFFTRRTGSGNSYQTDPARQGDFYIECRVFKTRVIEHRHMSELEKSKYALVQFKTGVNADSSVWRSVAKSVSDTKETFKGIRPIV